MHIAYCILRITFCILDFAFAFAGSQRTCPLKDLDLPTVPVFSFFTSKGANSWFGTPGGYIFWGPMPFCHFLPFLGFLGVIRIHDISQVSQNNQNTLILVKWAYWCVKNCNMMQIGAASLISTLRIQDFRLRDRWRLNSTYWFLMISQVSQSSQNTLILLKWAYWCVIYCR